MTTKEVADKYLEKSTLLLKNTNRNALILLGLIFFSWLYLMEPLHIQFELARNRHISELQQRSLQERKLKRNIQRKERDIRNTRLLYEMAKQRADQPEFIEYIDSASKKKIFEKGFYSKRYT